MNKFNEVKAKLVAKLNELPPYAGSELTGTMARFIGYKGGQWRSAPTNIKRVITMALYEAGYERNKYGRWMHPRRGEVK